MKPNFSKKHYLLFRFILIVLLSILVIFSIIFSVLSTINYQQIKYHQDKRTDLLAKIQNSTQNSEKINLYNELILVDLDLENTPSYSFYYNYSISREDTLQKELLEIEENSRELIILLNNFLQLEEGKATCLTEINNSDSNSQKIILIERCIYILNSQLEILQDKKIIDFIASKTYTENQLRFFNYSKNLYQAINDNNSDEINHYKILLTNETEDIKAYENEMFNEIEKYFIKHRNELNEKRNEIELNR